MSPLILHNARADLRRLLQISRKPNVFAYFLQIGCRRVPASAHRAIDGGSRVPANVHFTTDGGGRVPVIIQNGTDGCHRVPVNVLRATDSGGRVPAIGHFATDGGRRVPVLHRRASAGYHRNHVRQHFTSSIRRRPNVAIHPATVRFQSSKVAGGHRRSCALAVLRELAGGESLSVLELAGRLRKDSNLVSKHLRWLREAGAVAVVAVPGADGRKSSHAVPGGVPPQRCERETGN